jgi:hypothetical protein
MYVVGYGEIGVRDFGLAVATLVISMNGTDILCIQQKRKVIETVNLQPSVQPLQPIKRLI